MKRMEFKDRKGYSYSFTQFEEGDINIIKNMKAGDGCIKINLSPEVIEKLNEFMEAVNVPQ